MSATTTIRTEVTRTGLIIMSLLLFGLFTPAPAASVEASTSASDGTGGLPADGQPAADVLASEDSLGNPTFVGGLTNRGPRTGSVW